MLGWGVAAFLASALIAYFVDFDNFSKLTVNQLLFRLGSYLIVGGLFGLWNARATRAKHRNSD